MPFTLNTQKHYKIWFSPDKGVFLLMRDQIRLINLRQQNPRMRLSLLYSARCLSHKARNKLKDFCEKNQITPVDFDSDIRRLLQDEGQYGEDRKLYLLAKREMTKPGGNFCAASHCARLISSVIALLGTYSDFDLVIDFSKEPDSITIKSPMVLPSVVRPGISYANIDFLAFAEDPENPNKLHEEACAGLKRIQQEVISRYENLERSFETPLPNGELSILLNVKMATFFIFACGHPPKNLFEFRNSIKSLDDNEDLLLKLSNGEEVAIPFSELKPFLLSHSVTNFSGASNYPSFFLKSVYAGKEDGQHELVQPEQNFQQAFKNSSLEENNLRHCVNITNSINLIGKSASETVGKERDASWTEFGQAIQEEGERKYREAASTFSKFWKKKKEKERLAALNKVAQESAPRLVRT